jgi:hypothetical protein
MHLLYVICAFRNFEHAGRGGEENVSIFNIIISISYFMNCRKNVLANTGRNEENIF